MEVLATMEICVLSKILALLEFVAVQLSAAPLVAVRLVCVTHSQEHAQAYLWFAQPPVHAMPLAHVILTLVSVRLRFFLMEPAAMMA